MAGSELSRGGEVGKSAFARVTTMIYWLIILEAMLVVFTSPGWVASLFLATDRSNLPLFIACLLPVGPAVAGVVFAWRRSDLEGPDLSPAARFWRGYRLNFADVLRWWVPYLLVMAVGGFVANNISLTYLPAGTVWVFLVLGLLATLWAGHMLILTSVFSFRTRDAARLSAYFFFRSFPTTLLYLSLLVICLGLTYLVGMWLPILLGSVLSLWYVRAAGRMMALATAQFTTVPEAPTESPYDRELREAEEVANRVEEALAEDQKNQPAA